MELRYQWYRGSEAIDGATGTQYGLTWDDLGSSISVSVTGTKSGYASVTKVSAAVGPVTGRGWWWWTTSDGLRAV